MSATSNGSEWTLRGDNGALYNCVEHEVVLSGPRDTGKTIAACVKAHSYCAKVPGCQGAIVRKTQKSLAGTVLKTFERIVAGQGVQTYGGASPERYIYPNGSTIWCGGMDNADKVLSSERDFIYVNQTEELALDDWEKLAGSCSGRAAKVAYPQLFGDCNPGGSRHWIRERAKQGKLKLLVATHKDNPDLYDERGVVTAAGKLRIAVLEALTGVRRLRLMEGVWATAEGAVYEMFNAAVHVKVRERGEMKRNFLAIDVGFTNPAVILDVGEDEDGRQHCFREFYERGVLPEVHVAKAREWWGEQRYELAAVDESAAGLIASLQAQGINAVGGKGGVNDGIALVQNRLAVKEDGRPRYTVDPCCINHINEFESYCWRPAKDVPVKENDHSMDALRYLQDALDTPTGSWGAADVPGLPAEAGRELALAEVSGSYGTDLGTR